MSEPATTPGLLTVEEYLAFEASSEIRHEYVGGMLYAMTGGTDRHNQIAGNVYIALREAARGTPCRVYITDMRVLTKDIYYYPDVMVACGELESDNPIHRRDPCLLVEVLSPSSAITDRREKLLIYREIPTLQAYFIVHQDSRRVERHFRDKGGVWQRGDLVNDATVPVPCPETVLTLADIYEDL